ncbi:MAG: YicC family protein [Deltaproteobacteria bacterium]|nr:YicC family protein [Deltaproteobacteria bacterium]
MIKSMTGFGSAQMQQHQYALSLEMKSVNHRYLEMKVRLPSDWNDLELKIRDYVKKKFDRGFFEIYLKRDIVPSEMEGTYVVHSAQGKNYLQALKKLAKDCGLPPPTLDHVLRNTDFIRYQVKKAPQLNRWKMIESLLETACDKLEKMRYLEGKSLLLDITKCISRLSTWVGDIEKNEVTIKKELFEKIQKRISDFNIPQAAFETRIEQEVVFLVDRSDITEELVRLKSHLKQFSDGFKLTKGAIGKQLDFLIQEMNREANTIASKTSNLSIKQISVDFKTELEKLREQIQNVE